MVGIDGQVRRGHVLALLQGHMAGLIGEADMFHERHDASAMLRIGIMVEDVHHGLLSLRLPDVLRAAASAA
jgi:hypothetical protein